jgi:AcrR family transcriptional regulator
VAGSARERIRQALIDLCYERGYRDIDLPMLIARAGVDEAAFDREFDDLEDCFCQIYGEIQDALFERVSAAIAGLPSWRDRVRTTAYAMLAYLEEDDKRARLLVVEGRFAGERAQRKAAESFAYVFELLDQGREEAKGEKHLSRATAEAIGGTVFVQMYAAFEEGSVEAVRARIPEMMYAAVLPYLGPEAAAEELRIRP